MKGKGNGLMVVKFIMVVLVLVVGLYSLVWIWFTQTGVTSSSSSSSSSSTVTPNNLLHNTNMPNNHHMIAPTDAAHNKSNTRRLDEFATTADGVLYRPGSHYQCQKRSGAFITLPRVPSLLIVVRTFQDTT